MMREQEKVHVRLPEDVEVTLNVLGVAVTVKASPDGQFHGAHRGERLGYGDLERIRKDIERIETEASQKTERRRRLKEAEIKPEPALLYRSGTVQPLNRRRRPGRGAGPDEAATLEPIQVRGIDQRSGLALIIRENGDKESMTWDLITRVLAGVEKNRLLDLAEKEQRANKEIPELPTIADVMEKVPVTEVSATWDEFRESWVVKFGRDELVVPSGYSARDGLEARILARLIVKHTPYKFTDVSAGGKGGSVYRAVGLVEYADGEHNNLASYDNLFKTEAEVAALDKAIRQARRAEEKRKEYLETLLFDHSQFTDGV